MLDEFELIYLEGFTDSTDKSKIALIELCVKVMSKWKEQNPDIELEKPMHFTKEQSAWIKKYVILKKREVLEEFRAKINNYLEDSSVFADFVVTDTHIDTAIAEMKGVIK